MGKPHSVAAVGIAFAMSLAASQAAAESDRLVHPPVARVIEPLEQPATTDEMLSGVEACKLALGTTGKFDPKVFSDLHWRRGAAYPDQNGATRTEYYNRNLVNDILAMSRVDGCFTKGKVSGDAQIAEIREQLIAKYALEPLDGQPAFAGLQQSLVGQFGDTVKDRVLVCDKFVLVMDLTVITSDVGLPRGVTKGTFLSITYGPVS
jgi:hypothetical protein